MSALEYRTLGSREVYRSRWLRLREDEILRADGTPGVYGVVSKADFAIVIPRHEDGSFTLVEQYRYPVGERCLEFPQGADEQHPDLDPVVLARQELAEETGLRAGAAQLLGKVHHAYGYSDQQMSIVLATQLEEGEAAREVEEQGMTVVRVTAAELGTMMRDGRIRDCASLAAYGMLLLHEADAAPAPRRRHSLVRRLMRGWSYARRAGSPLPKGSFGENSVERRFSRGRIVWATEVR